MKMSLVMARRKLLDARIQAGFTQKGLAQELGTTQTNVSRWERGVVAPSIYYKTKLCAFFRRTACDLGLDDLERVLPDHKAYSDNAPFAYRHLIGREQELLSLRHLLARKHGLIAVTGLPGVGKTALVAALVRDPHIRELFPDGVLWAPLGINPNKSIFRRWGKILGILEEEQALLHTSAEWGTALRNAIGSRRILIILDDAWKEETALPYLIGGPNCEHILTTRYPALASGLTDVVCIVRELDEEQSLLLLRNLALDDAYEPELRKLISTVGGLPLALRLLGGYLRKEGRNQQPRRIQAAFTRLQQAEVRLHLAHCSSPDEPHSLEEETAVSLHMLLAASDKHLSPHARTAFYSLGVFLEKPASFSEEAALAITRCGSEVIDELTDAGLVETQGERYTLHQVIADYARLNFEQQPAEVRSKAYQRLVDFTLEYASAHQFDIGSLDKECYLYRVALAAADEQYYHYVFLRLVATLSMYIRVCLIYGVEFYMSRAIELAPTLENDQVYPCLITILEERIRLRRNAGDHTTATSLAQFGRSIAQKAGDTKSERLFVDLLSGEDRQLSNQAIPNDWCGVPQSVYIPAR
jgi:DNA-binding XRE family transcriptional regulator